MKAVVYHNYGLPDVLNLEEVEIPTPKPEEVLVKVHATSINAGDSLLLSGEVFIVRLMMGGVRKPKRKILGMDAAGRVEAVGSSVTQFKPGDEVYGDVSTLSAGGWAEYVTVPEQNLALKPKNVPFEVAATVPVAGMTALQGLRNKGKIQAGQKVLITGASGGVGSFAVQLAKYFGAEVTATCSTSKMNMVRSLGADHVIDYTREDIIRSRQRYDLILDIAAYRPVSDYRPILNPKGIYVLAGGSIRRILRGMIAGPIASLRGGQTFTNVSQKVAQSDLVLLGGLLEAGKVVPAIDRCYPLLELVEALRYFRNKQVRGKIAITVG